MNCQLGEERSNITAWSAERSGQLTGSRAIVSLSLPSLIVALSVSPSPAQLWPLALTTIYGLKWKYPASLSLPSPCIVNLAPASTIYKQQGSIISRKDITHNTVWVLCKIPAPVGIIFYFYLSNVVKHFHILLNNKWCSYTQYKLVKFNCFNK